MTRLGRRDGRGVESARTDGSAASVREQKRRVGYTDPTRATDRKTTGDRVFSIDERVTGCDRCTHTCVERGAARHVSDDRTTHPERPPDRATPRRSRRKSEKPQGRTHADREVLKRSRGRKATDASTPERDTSGGRLPPERARDAAQVR